MNLFEYITHKNINYCFEREVRAVAFPPAIEEFGASHFRDNHFESETKKGFLVYAPQVDLSSLIHGVVLHPESTAEFATIIRAASEKAGLPQPIASTFCGEHASIRAL